MQGTAPVLATMTKSDGQSQERVQVQQALCHSMLPDFMILAAMPSTAADLHHFDTLVHQPMCSVLS